MPRLSLEPRPLLHLPWHWHPKEAAIQGAQGRAVKHHGGRDEQRLIPPAKELLTDSTVDFIFDSFIIAR